jgi:AcrR family transcriptional regulator
MPRSKEKSKQMRARSRAQILAAARRLFAERGYFSCRMSDIAREAGMSTGNVYWYFSSKEEVLKAVLADGFEAQEAVLRDAATHPGTNQEKLDYLVEQYVALCQERGDFFAISVALLGHSGVSFFQELGFDTPQLGARYHQYLSNIFAQGRTEGTVANLESDLLAMFFFSFFNGLMITYGDDWLTHPFPSIRAAVLRLLGGSVGGKETQDV